MAEIDEYYRMEFESKMTEEEERRTGKIKIKETDPQEYEYEMSRRE